MNLKNCRRIVIIICFALGLLWSSCKKSESSQRTVYSASYGTVTINKQVLRTIDIGHQTWTADNCYGVGGGETGMFHQINALNIVTPGGWRVPSIADFNKLTSNVSIKKDANGNYVGGPDDDLQRLLNVSVSYSPSFFFNGVLDGYEVFRGPVHSYERDKAGYYITSDPTPDRFIDQAYLYKLNQYFAGVVYLTRPDSAIQASLRFVKDN